MSDGAPAPTPDRTRPWPTSWAGHAAATVKLAAPVIVARAGFVVMMAISTAMTGHAGGGELAALGLGLAPQLTLMLIGIGMLQGTAVLVAQAHGAGEYALCGRIWRVAALHAVALGAIFAVLCLFGETVLLAIGQAPELARGAGGVLRMLSWGMPPLLVFVATSGFLEGIGRPQPGMMTMLAANVVNLALGWPLIFGHFGLPAMGAEGAALAMSIVRWLIALGLVGYVLVMRGGAHHGIRGAIPDAGIIGRKLRRLAVPLGVAQGLETTAFTAVALFAGYLGATAMAAYQVAINIIALLFMGAIGLAAATAVRVGHAVGRQDQRGMARAGWTGVALVILVMAAFGVLVGSLPQSVAALYTTDAAVIATAAGMLAIGALMLVFDGVQVVLMGALRGAGDVVVPLTCQAIAFWALAVPGAWLLAFTWGWGTEGLIGGLLIGVVFAAVAQSVRFAVVSRRRVQRL